MTNHQLLPTEQQFLAEAARYLEQPSLLIRLANAIGKPLEVVAKGMEAIAPNVIDSAVRTALTSALRLAISTLPREAANPPGTLVAEKPVGEIGADSKFWSNLSVAATGTAGGLFGWLGLAAELPMTTTIMLRSIAAVAKDAGENLGQPEVQLQCLSVFSLGGPSDVDDALEASYLTARFGVYEAVAQSARLVGQMSAVEFSQMLQRGSSPALVALIAAIARRFDVAVTQKVVAQAIPLVGAGAGAMINVAFMDHFNRVARYHFGIRSLERLYGLDFVQDQYRAAALAAKRR
ncbi:MAG: EcsC family protein [Planctomycetes bacterium]|nr:EcsC family protein [Planctomycetota bacterium]